MSSGKYSKKFYDQKWYFEIILLCRVLSDVPKATGPSPAKQSNTLPATSPPAIKVKVKPAQAGRKSLVSSLLRQRRAAWSTAAESGTSIPSATQKPLSATSSSPVTSQVCKALTRMVYYIIIVIIFPHVFQLQE